jgi:two-component system, chemotaxis family, protein-glutamate methylesterase/glutaminase
MAEPERRDVVVIGASAGGLDCLTRIAGALSPDLPAAVFMVLHLSAGAASALPAIISRSGRLPAAHPRHGEATQRGRIYVAPPDHHMVMEPGVVLLGRGPREKRVRPAIDVLFRSAAHVYGPRVIGVVLSGYLDDGAAGLLTIKQRRGLAVVQDPEEAQCPSMPEAALEAVAADHVVRVGELGPLINRLVGTAPDPDGMRAPTHTLAEVESSTTRNAQLEELERSLWAGEADRLARRAKELRHHAERLRELLR